MSVPASAFSSASLSSNRWSFVRRCNLFSKRMNLILLFVGRLVGHKLTDKSSEFSPRNLGIFLPRRGGLKDSFVKIGVAYDL